MPSKYNIFDRMQDLLILLQQMSSCKDDMRQACKLNGLNTALAGQLTIAKLKLLSDRFKKAYSAFTGRTGTTWIQNQLKAFNWILIALSALENAKISQFSQKQWILLQGIFNNKTRNFLKFEARRFLQEKKSKNKNWNEQQNRLLLKIVNEMQRSQQIKIEDDEKGGELLHVKSQGMLEQKSAEIGRNQQRKERVHWNEVARRLFEQSHQLYFRSAKHCRERWYNYIDPTIERGKWNDAQDDMLVELVKSKGKKWSEIAGILHRTQHTVKNRYHSLQIKVRKGPKKHLKLKPKPKIEKTSIEEHKGEVYSVQQQNVKPPMITITQFPDKLRCRQSKSEVQNYLQDVDNIAQTVGMGDQRYPSFFAFSPINLTPLMGSPSPLTFNLRGFANSLQSFNDAISKKESVFSNQWQ